jgi:hypothetical protein
MEVADRLIVNDMKTFCMSFVCRRGVGLSLCLLPLALAGCATTGYQKSDAAARSLQRASYTVQAESRALSLTLQNLKSLVDTPGADLKPQFKKFNAALDWLIKESDRNDKADREIADRSAAYFKAWDKEMETMSFEAVRSKSQGRRTEAANDFQRVHQRYLEAQNVMQPLLSYLEDVRKALGTDLTQHGLEALKPIVVNADENAGKVQLALTKLSSELSACGTRLSSFHFQPASRATNNTSGSSK